MINNLNTGLSQLGLKLHSPEKLINYIQLLCKWNKTYNLTAITDPNDMLIKHIFDSLAISPYLHGSNILDIGSGAGLPGIPLAIALPDKHFTLLDANKKKTRFLIQATHELGLKNITIDDSRIENFSPDLLFDTITARAFSSLTWLSEQATRLLAPKGQIIAMKGKKLDAFDPHTQAHFKVIEQIELTVPGLNAERHIVKLSNQ